MREKGFALIFVLAVVALGAIAIGSVAYFQLRPNQKPQSQPMPSQTQTSTPKAKVLLIRENIEEESYSLNKFDPSNKNEILLKDNLKFSEIATALGSSAFVFALKFVNVSNDLKKISFTDDTGVWMQDSDGRNLRKVLDSTSSKKYYILPKISPDARKLAILNPSIPRCSDTGCSNLSKVIVVNFESGDTTEFSFSENGDVGVSSEELNSVSWFADSKRLLVVTTRGGIYSLPTATLWEIDSNTGEKKEIITLSALVGVALVSDSKIAYADVRGEGTGQSLHYFLFDMVTKTTKEIDSLTSDCRAEKYETDFIILSSPQRSLVSTTQCGDDWHIPIVDLSQPSWPVKRFSSPESNFIIDWSQDGKNLLITDEKGISSLDVDGLSKENLVKRDEDVDREIYALWVL